MTEKIQLYTKRYQIQHHYIIRQNSDICTWSNEVVKTSDVSSRTCPCPWSQNLVFVLGLGSQVLGFGLCLEVKSSAIILKTLISSVYYYWQFEHKTEKVLNISFWHYQNQWTSNCRCGNGFWMSLVLTLSFLALGLVLSPCPWPCFSCRSLALNTKSLKTSLVKTK